MALPEWIKTRLLDGSNQLVKIVSSFTGIANQVLGTNDLGYVDLTLFPPEVAPPTKTYNVAQVMDGSVVACLISIIDDTDIVKADADAGLRCDGYILESYALNDTATVYFKESLVGATGLTPGAPVYLSATAGVATTTHPTLATNNISQQIGIATETTEFLFRPLDPYVVA